MILFWRLLLSRFVMAISPSHFNYSRTDLKAFLQQGISEIEFRTDLVYFRKKFGFFFYFERFIKNVTARKNVSNCDAMSETACRVAVIIDSYAMLFPSICTTIGCGPDLNPPQMGWYLLMFWAQSAVEPLVIFFCSGYQYI